MFWQMKTFLHMTGMESVVNVTKTLIEKDSSAWSRMSANFHPIGESTYPNPTNKKFVSSPNVEELLSKSSVILFHCMLRQWN